MKNRAAVQKSKTVIKRFVFICAFIALVALLLKYTDKRVMPSVITTMEMHGENKSVRAIDGAVQAVIGRSEITSADLYNKSVGEDGRLTSLSADTMLINTLCAQIAEEALARLEEISDETIYLPLGIITGLDFMATKGPEIFKVTVKPLGHCVVDYKTSFKALGINQVNYQIWLEIKTRISVVNPVIDRSFTVERRLPVVNTYIGGEVPESMLYPFRINENDEENPSY